MTPNELNPSQEQPASKPWGIWATSGFSLIIAIAFFITQLIGLVVFLIFSVGKLSQIDAESIQALSESGSVVSFVSIATATVCTCLIWAIAKLRKNYSVQDYLSLKSTETKELGKWLLVVVLFIGVFDAITYFLNRPIVPEWVVNIYQTADSLPLLYLAIIVAAPISEEVFFRGFLFQGLRYSPLGNNGALAISSISWALIHVQYDAYQIFTISIFGLILGYARLKTNSIYVPIAMHGLNNLISLIETVIYLRFFAQ